MSEAPGSAPNSAEAAPAASAATSSAPAEAAPLAASPPDTGEGGESLIGGSKGEAAPAGTPFDAATFEYPEGMEVSDEQKGFLTKFATDYKVPAEGVKSLLDQYVQMSQAAADKLGKQLDNEWTATSERWTSETKAHYVSEAKLNDAIAQCERVIDEFGSDAIYEHLKTTGLANNLAVMQMFEKIGRALGEPKPVPPAGAQQSGVTSLADLYPTMAQKDK